MPPVMGAAAFLMVEYVGITYVEVVKHAFIPAVISYIALLYIVHLEALKANMQGIPKQTRGWTYALISFGVTIASIIILSGLVYYGIGWIKKVFPDNATYIAGGIIVFVYLALLRYAAAHPPLEMDDPNRPIKELPETAATLKTGLFFLLPIVVLIWCLMVERLSPGLSAFWATVFMMFILITQKPLLAFFRKEGTIRAAAIDGAVDLLDGLITGARNMTGIGIATATAGIIVGSVSLTGVGQVMTELIELISGGSFVLVLIFTAIICLILGMGLPTTANYIVVASLMAKVIEDLGKQNGLDIPPIAIHLFVFYFGIMADVTPPVGLASFAAAAVSGGDPIRTGIQAFVYSIRTVILPFIFIYNTDLLLVGIDSVWHAIFIFILATIAILLFASSTQGYFLVRNKFYESVILLLVAFSLFRPEFFVNVLSSPYEETSPRSLEKAIGETPEGMSMKLHIKGENLFGDTKRFIVHLPVETHNNTPHQTLNNYGLVLRHVGPHVVVDDVVFNSQADKDGISFDFVVESVEVPREQFSQKWIHLGSVLLLGFVLLSQRPRRNMRIALQERREERRKSKEKATN
jgi:TRAP transporter 4TM/12TM fusion protein